MVDESDAVPPGALEDIAYLARSANRVRLIETLASGSHTRQDLADLTGIARTTVGRIVNEFETREWAERTEDGTYTATPVGEQVVTEFAPLVDSMAVIRKLGETVAWFRAPDRSLDLRHLADSTVWRPDPADPMAPTRAYMGDLRTASEFHCLVGVAPPESFEKEMRDGAVERGMRAEHVISESEFSYLCDYPDRAVRWREYLEAGANVYRYDGDVPCNILILDGNVYVANTQGEYGEPYTVIETDDPAVRSWAHEVIDSYRADAEKLGPDAFAD